VLTAKDLSAALSQRFADSKANNPNFTTSFLHRMFGAGNASFLLTLFGGSVAPIRTLLLEERIEDGWVPANASRFGVTLAAFNNTAIKVALGRKRSRRR